MPNMYEAINLLGGPLDGKHHVLVGSAAVAHRLIAFNPRTGWSGESYSDDADWSRFGIGDPDLVVLEYESVDAKRPVFRARRYRYCGAFERVVTKCDVHRQHVSKGAAIPSLDAPHCSIVEVDRAV